VRGSAFGAVEVGGSIESASREVNRHCLDEETLADVVSDELAAGAVERVEADQPRKLSLALDSLNDITLTASIRSRWAR
jgi:hypothetical protein